MLRFRDLSITQKLTWMNMLASAAALLLACAAFMVCALLFYRQAMVRQASVGAQIIGMNCISALIFNDRREAERTVDVLRTTPHAIGAWVYTPEGRPFAGFWREQAAPPPPLPAIPRGTAEAHRFEGRYLRLVRSIIDHNKTVAYVYLLLDVGWLYDQLLDFGAITLAVLMASLFTAFSVSWVSRRVIAKPIQDLSETARMVSRDKNYAVRAISTGGRDEIAMLVDAFNSMLARIQERDDALQKAQDSLNLALTSAEVGTWSLDIPNQVSTWDEYTHQLFGLKPGTFRGKMEDLKKLVHPEDWDAVASPSKMPQAGDGTSETQFRVIWPDGSVHILAARSRVYRNSAGKALQRVGVCWDITQRKRAEQALSESEERYRFLFETNPHSMWIYDAETLAFLGVNDTAVEFFGFGREEFLRMKVSDLYPAEVHGEVPGATGTAEQGFGGSGTASLRKKDGAIVYVEFASHTLPFGNGKTRLVSVGDITDRKKLEDQLRQSQKMEAIGRLAGGVAHDFNNLLTIIGGYCQMLRDQLASTDPRTGFVAEIHKASERAAALTRQLLAFSRQQVLAPRLVDLNELITNTEKMLRRLIGEDIELLTRLQEGVGKIRADPGQIEQVIINLVVNSRDAMPCGGRVSLETSNVNFDKSSVREHPEISPGRYVMLAVSDTGTGIDPETQKHIFEPFFTTKEKGKGTGLGLAMVYGIVKQSGGSIWVYSELKVGTVFKLYFPRQMEAAEPPSARPAQTASAGGSETILLVEDELALRMLVKTVLERRGYTILAPADVTEALDVSEQHTGPIHLLLTDVVMPKMSGRELAEQVTRRHREIKVIYMSGYTNDAVVQHGVLESEMTFIQKPFTPDSIAKKVREVLDTVRQG